MAEVVNPIIPFEPRTTMTIDRANRLMGLKSHPGFQDLVALSLETVRLAEAAVTDYQGWDKDELVARSIAFRAAKKSHEMLFYKMATVIEEGVLEATQKRQNNNDADADAMAEELKVEVFRQLDERFDSRVGGSF
jgi:hypothetical protein